MRSAPRSASRCVAAYLERTTETYHPVMGGGEGEPPSPTEEGQDSDRSIGVAISGGGVRAAIFSLGALMYLVHSNLHRNVRLISSVSGGSIVNAVIAKSGDFSESDAVSFGRLAGRMGSRMAKHGVFFWPGVRRILLPLLPLALWAPLMIGLLNLVGEMDGWDWSAFWFGEKWFTGLMSLYFILYLVFNRRGLQQALPKLSA